MESFARVLARHLVLRAQLWQSSPMSAETAICPPEWSPQAAVLVGWPRLPEEWGDAYDLVKLEISGFVRALAQFTPVKLVTGDETSADEAYTFLGDTADIVQVPMGDIWLRDTGPVIGQTASGQWTGLSFAFNGWGGKYVMPGDAKTAGALCGVLGLRESRHGFTLEGGAVDLDGAGRLITTRSCVLNGNRNSGWTEDQAEAALRAAFGVSSITWLDDGLYGDHTDGHVDNIARFVSENTVVCQRPSGDDDPNADVLVKIEEALIAAGHETITVPSPGRICADDGTPLPASHMNFLITNGAVLLPVYEATYAADAADALAKLFPEREILALPARHILEGGGAFHCMTQQVPAGALP